MASDLNILVSFFASPRKLKLINSERNQVIVGKMNGAKKFQLNVIQWPSKK